MIRIDTSSFTPFYEQVKLQLKARIRRGVLRPGDPLPSIRELASSLLLNPNTVARAYRELEQEGLITTRKGKGCFVAETASKIAGRGGLDGLCRLLDDAIKEADTMDIPHEKVKGLLNQRLRLRTAERQGRKKP
jgi:GntR family transcriptional regulator